MVCRLFKKPPINSFASYPSTLTCSFMPLHTEGGFLLQESTTDPIGWVNKLHLQNKLQIKHVYVA